MIARFKILALFTVLGISLSAFDASAYPLEDYLKGVGAPTDVSITETSPQGATRVGFQSQLWRELPWKHELIIEQPKVITHPEYVALVLTGGTGGDEQRRSTRLLSESLGIRAAVLTQVPNQPLFGGKKEDDLLSFTLDQYRQSGDPSWPLLFPMVTSVVKSIDVLEEILDRKHLKIILVGASKRGWTTYLSSAVDKRISIIIPAVFEMISIPEQIALAQSRYGKDSEKIRAYTALGLTSSLTAPRIRDLITWLDPISYASKMTAPKLLVLGSNDPYWVTDSSKLYWNRLSGPKVLRTVANVGHGALQDPLALRSVLPFLRRLIQNKPIPSVSWSFSDANNPGTTVSGKSDQPLTKCNVWRAESSDRDLRDDLFIARPCSIGADGKSFSAEVDTSATNTTAFFAELEVAGTTEADGLVVSTETRVVSPAASNPTPAPEQQ